MMVKKLYKKFFFLFVIFALILIKNYAVTDIDKEDKIKDKDKKDKTEKIIEKELKKDLKDAIKENKDKESIKTKKEKSVSDFSQARTKSYIEKDLNSIEAIILNIETLQSFTKESGTLSKNKIDELKTNIGLLKRSIFSLISSLDRSEVELLRQQIKIFDNRFNSVEKKINELENYSQQDKTYNSLIDIKKDVKEIYRAYRALEWLMFEN